MNIKKFLNKTLSLPEAASIAHEALKETSIGKFIKGSPNFFLLNQENVISYFVYAFHENGVPFYGKSLYSHYYEAITQDRYPYSRTSRFKNGHYNLTQVNGKPLYEDIRIKRKDVKKYIREVKKYFLKQKIRQFLLPLSKLLDRFKRVDTK